ncbi:MAG: AraC family transcriptional regulator [Pseudomonadota bacterium]
MAGKTASPPTASAAGAAEQAKVSIYQITQATTATFTELYFRLTFLFFIQRGSKYVLSPTQGEMEGHEGDLMIFPPGSIVTMENRPVMNADYRALGVCFTHDLVDSVFADVPKSDVASGVQIVRAKEHNPSDILSLIQETLDNDSLPETIKQHRLIEPLLWLRGKEFYLPTKVQDDPISQIRSLIETDLSHSWMAGEVAQHFAMSEATMRRWLSKTGQGFAKILLNTRLEYGLTLLQTTDAQVSQIALECGFKTPSHFSDAFRKRFGIKPKDIRSAAD